VGSVLIYLSPAFLPVSAKAAVNADFSTAFRRGMTGRQILFREFEGDGKRFSFRNWHQRTESGGHLEDLEDELRYLLRLAW